MVGFARVSFSLILCGVHSTFGISISLIKLIFEILFLFQSLNMVCHEFDMVYQMLFAQ